MKNFLKQGDVVTRTAPGGGVVSGSPVLIGSQLVVPTTTQDAGDEFEGVTKGVCNLPKTTAEAWTEGAKLYWNNGTSKVTTTSGGNTLIGCADAAADAADATGDVYLDGVVR